MPDESVTVCPLLPGQAYGNAVGVAEDVAELVVVGAAAEESELVVVSAGDIELVIIVASVLEAELIVVMLAEESELLIGDVVVVMAA